MGCFPSSNSRVNSEYTFNASDISYLIQSWSIIKSNDHQKFAQDILIRSSNESSSFRRYWRSKILVDGNNYDYGQHDSCLRTDSSWHIGLREYSAQFISIFDQLLLLIHDANRFFAYLQSVGTSESIFLVDHEALLIMKKCMMEILHERFNITPCDANSDYEKVWEKFLAFIIDYITKLKNTTEIPSKMIIPPIAKKE